MSLSQRSVVPVFPMVVGDEDGTEDDSGSEIEQGIVGRL